MSQQIPLLLPRLVTPLAFLSLLGKRQQMPCRHPARAQGSAFSCRINIYQPIFPISLVQDEKPVHKAFYFIREFFCFGLFF